MWSAVPDFSTPLRIVQAIDAQQHNKDAHSTLLEKEMGAALTELQALVQEGRSYIAKEVGGGARVWPRRRWWCVYGTDCVPPLAGAFPRAL